MESRSPSSHDGRAASRVAIALILAALSGCGVTHGPTPAPSTPRSASHSAVAPASPVPVESNPPGDIPDNLAFVPYTDKTGGYTFTHPEGWAVTRSGSGVQFTDKLNGVNVESLAASKPRTVRSAKAADVPRLKASVPAFELRGVNAISLPGGSGVRIVFRRNSDSNAVTGKIYRDEVEEFLVFKSGRLVRMDLYGPVGADNVDAYRVMSRSLRIR
jgi:hypothetical protein